MFHFTLHCHSVLKSDSKALHFFQIHIVYPKLSFKSIQILKKKKQESLKYPFMKT